MPIARRARFSAKTHTGLVRAVNEDAVLALPEQGIWIVSDGMGGYKGGAFASQTVVDAVAMQPPDASGVVDAAAVADAVMSAHTIIQAEADRAQATMGATVVALILSEDRYQCLWSGDSRLYLLRQGDLQMISTDHSVVADLVKAGEMDWDEADQSAMSNQITQAVGVGEHPGLEHVAGPLEPGDRFLLCSDGLTKYANRKTLLHVMAHASIEHVVERLLEIAMEGGADDNITLVVVEIPRA
ncbi:PP2C family protein-serine/threonine phosphatase [Tropicimonas sp. S265A]|uniref:PP2C family protein-serine/threonine phosphatase n=1 Tax=Tropicimonas sp. S265A TaxID=3415134 RepID=UPI003C7C95ED